MRLKAIVVFLCVLLVNVAGLFAGESLLWKQELPEPAKVYASPALDGFLLSYNGGEDAVYKSSGIAVYDRNWTVLWKDPSAVLEDISWHAGVIAVRIPSISGQEQPTQSIAAVPALGFSEEAGGEWRILDVYTGKIIREFNNYAEAGPVLNTLPLFREPENIRESLLRVTGLEWRVSGITEDGQYLSVYNPSEGGYKCGIYKKSTESGESWAPAGPCGGGTLLDGGYLLYGENIIPAGAAEMEAFVSSRALSLRVGLKAVEGKEVWVRVITLKHGLDHHVLLDNPIVWKSGGKIVVYTGPALQLFDMEGAAGAQIPYATDMAVAKTYENRLQVVSAPRLALTTPTDYLKFYCWDEEESGKFKRRVIKLYKGNLLK